MMEHVALHSTILLGLPGGGMSGRGPGAGGEPRFWSLRSCPNTVITPGAG
jgi:hypothetical protein